MCDSHCFTIGLTGGIASGKSTVSDLFKELGCTVIDADIVAREVVIPGSEGLIQIVKEFGNNILEKNKLNRGKLRKLVFNDKEKLSLLNSILHPLINTNIVNQIKRIKDNYCIVVIPLLCESIRYDWLDRVLVVDVAKQTQFNRLEKRDNVSRELASNMIESQCSRNKRLEIADDVINNELSVSDLQSHVKNLNSLYKSF